MNHPVHAISARKEMSPERIIGIGFVGILHVVAIWAIVNGLGQKIYNAVMPPDPIVMLPQTEVKPPPPAPPIDPPTVDVPDVTTSTIVPPPDFTIQDETQPQQRTQVTTDTRPVVPVVPDTSAAGVTSTHTTPPYPPLAAKLGEQGKVQLRLAISPQGIVTAAEVVQSSGFADLDQAAINWVIANWKYKPAVQAGSPVASTTGAIVVFSLKNAR